MPWKVSHVLNERMRFVMRLEQGERMSDLCREYGISRKTGYKFQERYKAKGPEGLLDESRRPIVSPFRVSAELRNVIVELKRSKPTWGPDKLKEQLSRKGFRAPSRATIHRILDQQGLVKKKKQRERRPNGEPFQNPFARSEGPNDLWCTDFKGEFMLGNRRYCYPLTVSDHHSRFLLGCEGLESTKGVPVKAAFAQIFEKYGVPRAILSDNGSPFGSRGLFGLSKLSVWWLSLGIQVVRIEPGHPEQNGRHERFHLTLKQETTRPPGANLLQQQEKFDRFQEEFNSERPHQALAFKCPGEIYHPSNRKYQETSDPLEYPFHELTRPVLESGIVIIPRRDTRVFLGHAFQGQTVGLREEDEGLWRLSFAQFDLGFVDEKQKAFVPLDRPEPVHGYN